MENLLKIWETENLKKVKYKNKTYHLYNKVSVDGKIGYITGFTGTCAYVQDIDGNYITQKGKSYKEWMEHKNNTSWKSQLRTDINESIKQANFYEEFLSIMKTKGYEIENTDFNNSDKDITFYIPNKDYFIRGNIRALGKNFTRERIKERIEQKPKERAKQMLHSTKINKLIDSIEGISDMRREFYKTILKERFEKILLESYNKLKLK